MFVTALLFGAIFLFFGVFFVYPLLTVLYQSVLIKGQFTWYFLADSIADPSVRELFFNSLGLAAVSTGLCILLALPLAILVTRYTFPFKSLVQALLLFPLFLPPFVGALGIRKLFSRFGPINLVLLHSGVISTPIDFLGADLIFPVALTQALHLFPILYLSLLASLSRLDPAYEDAARTCGASWFRVFYRIRLPLLTAGLLAGCSLVFIWAFTDLGTPLIFGYRDLLAVKIFDLRDEIHENPAGYSLVAYVMVISVFLYVLGTSLLPVSKAGSGIKGSTKRPQKALSGAPLFLVLFVVALALGASLLPHASILVLSLTEKWFMSPLPTALTLHWYEEVFRHPLTVVAIKNSLVLSSISALLDVVIGLAIGYFVHRTNLWGKKVLDLLAMAPLALPGIILAFGYLGSFSGTMLDPRVNPMPLLVIGYAIRRVPFMVRSVGAGFQELPIALENAARVAGASQARTLRRISIPILLPHIFAGAILCFAFAMLEVSESLFLAMEEKYFPLAKAMYALTSRPDGPYVASALGVVSMILIAGSLWVASRLSGRGIRDLLTP